MNTYSKLQSRYNEFRNLETEYWGHLREALGEIVDRTAQLLALPDSRKLRLGVFKDSGEFESLSSSNIPATSRKLEFALLLVLADAESEIPPSTLKTHWSMWRDGRELMLSSGSHRITVSTYDQAALFMVSEFGSVLEQSDPFLKTDIV